MNYPPEYMEALHRAYSDGDFAVPCSSIKEARVLRGNFYAFRSSLRRRKDAEVDIAEELLFELDGPMLRIRRKTSLIAATLRAALSGKAEGTPSLSTPNRKGTF